MSTHVHSIVEDDSVDNSAIQSEQNGCSISIPQDTMNEPDSNDTNSVHSNDSSCDIPQPDPSPQQHAHDNDGQDINCFPATTHEAHGPVAMDLPLAHPFHQQGPFVADATPEHSTQHLENTPQASHISVETGEPINSHTPPLTIASIAISNPSQDDSSVPPLSLGALPTFQSQGSIFASRADEPPPYSPTHTILPHYFSLEPIPIRTYIIKDSAALPFLYDFWLCTSTSTDSTSRPQSPTIQLQERGLSHQHHQNELKYCLIRPQRTDRTAFPMTTASGPNAYFIPALALVAASFPSRWIWWGTEALQMVVFGRLQKNVVMEWKWKHGRTRIGGPIVSRLIGCSFRVRPEIRYCWKIGSGKRRQGVTATMMQQRQQNHGSGVNGGNRRNRRGRSNSNAVAPVLLDQSMNRTAGGSGSWFTSFFNRTTSSPTSTSATVGAEDDIAMGQVRIPIQPNSSVEGESSNQQEIATDVHGNADSNEDDYDEEAGCYHCREESSNGVMGQIVAVYKPGRPANRARDRPATSRRLEIYTEIGERCETAMMLMCMRLDDLFLSIPEQKKMRPFDGVDGLVGQTAESGVDAEREPGNSRDEGSNGDETQGGVRLNSVADADDGARQTSSQYGVRLLMLKRLFGGRDAWKSWVKWIVAAILIAVVVVLILKRVQF